MKNLLIILFVAVLASEGFGQEKMKFDTIDAYHFGGSGMTVQGTDTTFQYNSKWVSSKEYFKYTNSRKPLEENNDYGTLYFVNMYNTGDTLLFSTNWITSEYGRFGDYIRYYPNGKIRTKGQYLFFGDNKEAYLKKGVGGQKTGKWFYYNVNGVLMKTEIWEDGKLTKSIVK